MMSQNNLIGEGGAGLSPAGLLRALFWSGVISESATNYCVPLLPESPGNVASMCLMNNLFSDSGNRPLTSDGWYLYVVVLYEALSRWISVPV